MFLVHYGLPVCVCALVRMQPMEEVESRLVQLGTLVPDMVNKLPRMRADIILKLIRDPKVRHSICVQGLLIQDRL